ncbi:tryptophan synthase subunit alpha [Sphingomonas sp. BN140010]|uniref:Tryptophan synthase alpha chain n=1 Tax=Sphingomonas arvum TaxID=2992113 RepID=A0ABT3JAY1_9SPHN|nr:tryptophan synthase subunit alpha [Sphingomonas sp. BN140010]MCW3796228.1 tryptophan synthase subunit alpha [Sphingomonas sp. BN140010]
MSRYAQMFQRLHQRAEGAFGGFLMLGDPDVATSVTLLDAVVEGGADMVEVGIPFSDPVADGPVIQAAADRALRAGVRVDDCFGLIRQFRAKHPAVPVGILTYANLLAARGRDKFMADAAGAGADSILVADVPSIEAAPYAAAAQAAGLELVMIAAPNTPEPVIRRIAELSGGYTYCVARAGVTGTSAALALDHDRLFAMLAEAGAPPPVLGFGISYPDQVAEALASGTAGVIAGSALVKLGADARALVQLVSAMKRATALPNGERER